MDNSRITTLLNEVRALEMKIGKMRYKALPILWFSIGLFSGLFLNLTANVLHEIFNQFGAIYKIIVLSATIFLVCIFLVYLRRSHLLPIDMNEREIENRFREIKELLIKDVPLREASQDVNSQLKERSNQ